MENNKRPTQAQRVLDYMNENGSISALEAVRDLACLQLGARIFELKRNGIGIYREWYKGENKYGKYKYCRYYLLKENL